MWKAEAVVSFRYFSVIVHSYMYSIVSSVYRSLDTNLEAAAAGPRLGQSDGRGGGGRGG